MGRVCRVNRNYVCYVDVDECPYYCPALVEYESWVRFQMERRRRELEQRQVIVEPLRLWRRRKNG